jgi:hypothetical protein
MYCTYIGTSNQMICSKNYNTHRAHQTFKKIVIDGKGSIIFLKSGVGFETLEMVSQAKLPEVLCTW